MPRACLKKWSTIMILVNDVSIIRIDGANEITVSTSNIFTVLEICPLSLLYIIENPLLISLLGSCGVMSSVFSLLPLLVESSVVA